MRRAAAFLVVALLAALPLRTAGAETLCGVLADAAGDVAGPYGAPRPSATAGSEVDLLGVDMTAAASSLVAVIRVADLSSQNATGTTGALYGVFFSLGDVRSFVQAERAESGWRFTSGVARGDDSLPQSGVIAAGSIPARNAIRIEIPRAQIGSPPDGASLEQIRAFAEETADSSSSVMSDRAGGDGGRFILGSTCAGGISGAGERCVIASDGRDATAGPLGSDDPTTVGPDPATEIVSVVAGTNQTTVIFEIGVASLRRPIQDGTDGESWTVAWQQNGMAYQAFARRSAAGASFGFGSGTRMNDTTGSLDVAAAVVRILIPRADLQMGEGTRLTSIWAQSYAVVGPQQDRRDAAPNVQTFSSQLVAGVSCAAQAAAACPVVLDDGADAGPVVWEGGAIPKNQPASDLLAAGADAPATDIVASMRVADLGAPPPDGFDLQGWTASWTYNGRRYYAQAERSRNGALVYRYGLNPNKEARPSDAYFKDSRRARGWLDLSSGTIFIAVPRGAMDSPADGSALTDFGATSWVMSTDNTIRGTPAAPVRVLDSTPLSTYVAGVSCGA